MTARWTNRMLSQMALVTRHWSGKHHGVVQGINLISLVWTDRECRLPCDFRLYNKAEDGLSKNDHFQQMIATGRTNADLSRSWWRLIVGIVDCPT